MSHKWISKNPTPHTPYFKFFGCHDLRECKKCGAIQTLEAQYTWMRVTGYKWTPKVGKCLADNKNWNGKLHKTAIK